MIDAPSLRPALVLGAVLLLVYCVDGTCLQHADPVAPAFTAMALAYHGDADLGRYVQDPKEALAYTVVRASDGALVSAFGFGAPLWAVPLFSTARALGLPESLRLADMGGKVAGAM